MSDINSNDIEKYQILLQQNPRSKVFAPLSEAYRKMGMLNEAAEVCEAGLKYNPDFAGGRLALARILMDKKDEAQAIEELIKATELAPENILAHLLLAECYIAEKQSKKALRSYKMVLFLNPENQRAKKAVNKLESLTADEYDDEMFSMEKLSAIIKPKVEEALTNDDTIPPTPAAKGNTLLDRHLSLVDAFVARNEIDKARSALLHAEEELGPLPEVIKRKQLVFRNNTFERYERQVEFRDNAEPISPIRPETTKTDIEIPIPHSSDERVQKLQEVLDRFEAYGADRN